MNNQIAVGIQEPEYTAQYGFGFKKKTTLNLRVSEYQLFHMIQLKSKFQQFIEAAKYQLKFLPIKQTIIATAEGDDVKIQMQNARLWSAETPNLYICRTILKNDQGKEVEKRDVKFSICQIKASPQGIFINGKSTLLRGGCVHLEHLKSRLTTCSDAQRSRFQRN